MRTATTKVIQKTTKTRLTFNATDRSKSMTFNKSGLLRYIISTSSDPTTAAITYTITITNLDGSTVYASGNLAHGVTVDTAISSIPLVDELHTLTVATSDVAGVSGMTVDVTLIVER